MTTPRLPAKVTSDIDRIRAATWNALVECVSYGMTHPSADGKTTRITEAGEVTAVPTVPKWANVDNRFVHGINAGAEIMRAGATVVVSRGSFAYAKRSLTRNYGVLESDVSPGCTGRAAVRGCVSVVAGAGNLSGPGDYLAPDGSGGVRKVYDSCTALVYVGEGYASFVALPSKVLSGDTGRAVAVAGGRVTFDRLVSGSSSLSAAWSISEALVSHVYLSGGANANVRVCSTVLSHTSAYGGNVVYVPVSGSGWLYGVMQYNDDYRVVASLVYVSSRFSSACAAGCTFVPLGYWRGVSVESNALYLYDSVVYYRFTASSFQLPAITIYHPYG